MRINGGQQIQHFSRLSRSASPDYPATPLTGPCQARSEPVAMARFRDLSHVCRMHAASAGLSAPRRPAKNAPVAQLDRALDYESRGQEFESLRARQFSVTPGVKLGTKFAFDPSATSSREMMKSSACGLANLSAQIASGTSNDAQLHAI